MGTIIPAVGGVLTAIAPFLPVLAAIAAAIAVVIIAFKNWDTIIEYWGGVWEKLKTKVTEIWDGLWKAAQEKFDKIKTSISDKINAARDAVHNAIERIKSFFRFEWTLPKLKLPHFKLEGEFSLVPPSVPKISVDWYKSAYQNAMILTSPAIFGASGGRLLGGGDGPGAEAVVGTDLLGRIVRENSGYGGPETIQITSPVSVTIGGQEFRKIVTQTIKLNDFLTGGRG